MRYLGYPWLAVLFVMMGGCADDSTSSAHPAISFLNAGSRNTDISAVEVHGATGEQQSVLRSMIARIDGKNVKRVTIGEPPSGVNLEAGETWLHIGILARSSQAFDESTANWEANLLAGAFRDFAKARGLSTVLGFHTTISFPRGHSRRSGRVIAGPFDHPISEASAEEIANKVRAKYESIAEAAGVERVKIVFLRPLQFALIIDVQAKKPVAVAEDFAFLKSMKLEGWLLRVRDLEGRPIALRSAANRTGTGGFADIEK